MDVTWIPDGGDEFDLQEVASSLIGRFVGIDNENEDLYKSVESQIDEFESLTKDLEAA